VSESYNRSLPIWLSHIGNGDRESEGSNLLISLGK
jgi:hypothetical protein